MHRGGKISLSKSSPFGHLKKALALTPGKSIITLSSMAFSTNRLGRIQDKFRKRRNREPLTDSATLHENFPHKKALLLSFEVKFSELFANHS